METYILISNLNDFLFCPKSIYFHNLYGRFDAELYHATPQVVGKMNHKNIDEQRYSSSTRYVQGISVYSESFELCGKIDILDVETHTLIERKTKIQRIYDGYLFQVYAQYYCLRETGYVVEHIALHSLQDNKRHAILLPGAAWGARLRKLIDRMRTFDPGEKGFTQQKEKCEHCIYRNLCDTYLR